MLIRSSLKELNRRGDSETMQTRYMACISFSEKGNSMRLILEVPGWVQTYLDSGYLKVILNIRPGSIYGHLITICGDWVK